MADAANINSSEVLKDLRRKFIAMGEFCEKVIPEALADGDRVQGWLERERFPDAKRLQRLAEQRFGEARIRYMAAKSRAPKMGRPMIEDEEKDFRRCKAALDQANEKLAIIKKAILDVPRMTDAPLTRIRSTRHALQELVQRSVAHLDIMIDGLEDYLQLMGNGDQE